MSVRATCNTIVFSNDIHLNKDAKSLLSTASNDFKNHRISSGIYNFVMCESKSPEHAHITFYFLYLIHNQPKGDPEYGRHAFYREYGKFATSIDRARAIDLAIDLIDKHEASQIEPSWWEQNQGTIITTAAIGGVMILTVGSIMSGLNTTSPSIPHQMIPGHIPVGGGHIIPGHVVVGGGHMDSPIQRLALTSGNSQSLTRSNQIMHYNHPQQDEIILCKSKHKKTEVKGKAKGSYGINKDSKGNSSAEANGKARVDITHKNGKQTSVEITAGGKVDQNGKTSGGARIEVEHKCTLF